MIKRFLSSSSTSSSAAAASVSKRNVDLFVFGSCENFQFGKPTRDSLKGFINNNNNNIYSF
jgi:hypothetical protein